ncbi:COP9 signalosome complex subunit [Histoplasma capsulatum G186AR]|uniref:COP9 signalosome complex subunit n=1 Tax=Ajellomyces capsulatus (strain G186AR / H82 / ATCC MYA-2454 / RMSCC 2432) TaxID=447093 RepID=C0NXR7_AJECG|nr:COP9 signalosome complex subunit [Histoplasma capsulatum G186AR]EEH03585.1 COP9 signalosome complex subunit [Histoplasma capsulatum G186AR]
MSDDDFMQDSDQEEYDFEYEDADEDEAGDVGIENKYYNAKQIKADNPEEAINEFSEIPALEEEKGDWGFKGLKQAIKLEFKLGRYEDQCAQAVEHYRELLTYIKSAVTRNYSEKSINNMLDYIEKGSDDAKAYHCMEKFYSLTLDSFQNTNNERLWLKTNIKLARLWLDRRENSTTLEHKRLKALYQRALTVRSAVPHPKIMGIIRECGGKMHLSEENWKEAQSDFFESFRNYDEAGSMQRIQVLKYLVLTTMLMKSNINPFDSQETKPYKSDPRISAMTDLVDAFQRDDIHAYEEILRNNPDVLSDPFIAENIDEVSRNMRTKAVLKLIAPYTRFSLAFISKQIKISLPEVQDILSFLILDQKIPDATIDQETGAVVINRADDHERLQALGTWTSQLNSLWRSVLTNADGFRIEDSARIHATLVNTDGGYGQLGLAGDVLPSPEFRKLGVGRAKRDWKGKSGIAKAFSRAL